MIDYLLELAIFCPLWCLSFCSLCYEVGRFFTIISLSDHLRLVVKSKISALVRHNCIWVTECCHLWFCANLSIASWGSVGSPSLIRLTFSSKPSNKLPCRSLLSERPACQPLPLLLVCKHWRQPMATYALPLSGQPLLFTNKTTLSCSFGRLCELLENL